MLVRATDRALWDVLAPAAAWRRRYNASQIAETVN